MKSILFVLTAICLFGLNITVAEEYSLKLKVAMPSAKHIIRSADLYVTLAVSKDYEVSAYGELSNFVILAHTDDKITKWFGFVVEPELYKLVREGDGFTAVVSLKGEKSLHVSIWQGGKEIQSFDQSAIGPAMTSDVK